MRIRLILPLFLVFLIVFSLATPIKAYVADYTDFETTANYWSQDYGYVRSTAYPIYGNYSLYYDSGSSDPSMRTRKEFDFTTIEAAKTCFYAKMPDGAFESGKTEQSVWYRIVRKSDSAILKAWTKICDVSSANVPTFSGFRDLGEGMGYVVYVEFQHRYKWSGTQYYGFGAFDNITVEWGYATVQYEPIVALLIPALFLFLPALILAEKAGLAGLIAGICIGAVMLVMTGWLPLWTLFLIGLAIIMLILMGRGAHGD